MKHHGGIVFAAGLTLTLIGAYGMWSSWDIIQLERGWAQYIAGAIAVSGGVITMALGRVIAAIRSIGGIETHSDFERPPESSQMETRPEATRASPPPPIEKPSAFLNPRRAISATFRRSAPVEVDRYVGGDAEYVMFSDGSVEVRRGNEAQRYPSLSALRAEAAARRG